MTHHRPQRGEYEAPGVCSPNDPDRWILRLFRAAKRDTEDIAEGMGMSEAEVANILHQQREKERQVAS